MKRLLTVATVATLLVGCAPEKDPVPQVADPRNIVVDGQPMTAQAFVERYCADKTGHETCVKVRRSMVADATKSKNGAARF